MTDNEIQKICVSDIERGFNLLVVQYQEPVYWHIRRMVVSHDDAEDLLQETFIRAFRGIDKLRKESVLSTWIYRIATNECLRWLTRQKECHLTSGDVSDELTDKLMASEYVDYENEMELNFQKAILSLPDKQRLVFNMRYYDDLSYEQISEITESSVESLKTNYHYAKQKIKEYMLK